MLALDDLMPLLAGPRMPLGASPPDERNTLTPFVLARGEVAHVGEAIALVVADSRAIAEDAAGGGRRRLRTAARGGGCAVGGGAGLAAGAAGARLHVLNSFSVGYGDTGPAFAEAAHVFEDTLSQHRGCGLSLEGRGVVAEPRPGGGLCVWSSTQMPNDVFNMLAEMLGLDETALRVVTPDVGGGFGPKYCIYPEELAVATAALLLGRPLKWIEDRRESFVSSVQERDQYWTLAIAVDAEARILGLRGGSCTTRAPTRRKPSTCPTIPPPRSPDPTWCPPTRWR